MTPTPATDAPRAAGWSAGFAVAIAAACVLNAFAFALLSANPLIQSDAWRYLDGFLGRFIEQGFAVRDLFAQDAPSDTNFPLHKLFLFFNTRYFDLDFRLDALLAVVSAAAGALVLARAAAARHWQRWGGREWWLLAVLALVWLSLNSTNLYTWPLAGLWFVPLLLAFAYIALVPVGGWRALLALAFAAGVLLDEFAIPVLAAGLAGGWASRRIRPGMLPAAGATAAGFLLSRVFYAAWQAGVEPAADAVGIERAYGAFLSPQAWKAIAIPLSDSLVHQANLQTLFAGGATVASLAMVVALLAGHAWFWWRVAALRKRGEPDAALHVAVSVMVLFYALVAGIVLQRVGQFGFDYLHQPRYVLFFQLNLLALAILAYRGGTAPAAPRRVPAAWGAGLAALVLLQAQLSVLAWDQTKYVSAYYQTSAHQIGTLAADPSASLQCQPIIRVCDFPAEKRQRIMGLLVSRQLNVFSPRFQALHRLHPGALPVAEVPRKQEPVPAAR